MLIEVIRSIATRLSVDIQELYAETTRTYRAHSNSLEAISRQVSSIDEIHTYSQESVGLLQNIYGSLVRLIEQRPQASFGDSQSTLVQEPSCSTSRKSS